MALAIAALLLLTEPVPQPLSYHQFADQHSWLGIPHAANVLSNLGFLFAGVLGLLALRRRACCQHATERRAWRWLFISVIATAAGSGWYHLAPDNARLIWDRLPMALGFMALLTVLLNERISLRFSTWLWPLMMLGAGSVIWWGWTESLGRGDLRPYLLVQFLPLLLMIWLLWRAPARYSHGVGFGLALAAYAAAKLTEIGDALIYDLSAATVSGHCLKHLLAALGVAALAWMLSRRQAR